MTEGDEIQSSDRSGGLDLLPPVERIARILWGAEQIRIELVVLTGTSGFLSGMGNWSHYRVQDLVPKLISRGIMPAEFKKAIRDVIDVRNAVAHGERVASPVLESIDELAMTVLARLREVPRSYHRVGEAEVALFLDQSLSMVHPSVGVLIEERDRDGELRGRHVYPTRAKYTQGRFVTWAWDMSHVSDQEAWYLDTQTNEPTVAFSEAAAYAGREFPEQWGLEHRGMTVTD